MRWTPLARCVALLGREPRLQRAGRRQLGIAEIAHEAEVRHDRRQPRVEALGLQAQHVQLAAGEAVGGDAVGVQA